MQNSRRLSTILYTWFGVVGLVLNLYWKISAKSSAVPLLSGCVARPPVVQYMKTAVVSKDRKIFARVYFNEDRILFVYSIILKITSFFQYLNCYNHPIRILLIFKGANESGTRGRDHLGSLITINHNRPHSYSSM